MTQPMGNCPGCGGDEQFEQVHLSACPDVDGECPEWFCVACGAGVFMGTVNPAASPAGTAASVTAGRPARAA
jgi:hypothetical protein